MEYNHEITAENEYKYGTTATIRPGYEGWMNHAPSLHRYTGDFAITAGNTTWNLRQVYFDAPEENPALDIWGPQAAPIGTPVPPSTGNGVGLCQATHG